MILVKKSKFIWVVFYLTWVAYFLLKDLRAEEYKLGYDLIYSFVESPQKLLFVNTIFFLNYLYVWRRYYLFTEVLVRCKSLLHIVILKEGLSRSFTYSVLTYCTIICLSSLFRVQWDYTVLFNCLRLIIFCMYIYLLYVFLYLVFTKLILALVLILLGNFIVLAMYIVLIFNRVDLTIWVKYTYHFFTFSILLLATLIIWLTKKRDYL